MASKKPTDSQDKRPLSLHPLSFDDAVTDILKIKPEPKAPKSKTPADNKPSGKS